MRTVLRRIRFWLEYAALGSLFWISRLFPRSVLLAWGRWLGSVTYGVLRTRRRVVLTNLRAAFGHEKNEQELQQLAFDFYRQLGMTLMEFFTLHSLSREDIRELVTLEGTEHLESCRELGRGAMLTSGHFGNWELLGAVIAAHGYPVHYLIKSQSNPYVDRMHNDIRARAGIGVIRQGASVRHLVYALRRNELVGILGDQDAGNQGLFMDFLGQEASVARGPAYMAFRTGCPVIPTAIIRQPDGRHRVIIKPPIQPDPTWNEERAVYELTRAHTAQLEQFIRQFPEQYFWVHRRWKTKSPAPVAVTESNPG
ncbi:MAG: lysophospholipid acyltransferase family protein [bacterium]